MLLIACFIFGLLGSLTWAGPRGRSICPAGSFAHKEGSEWSCYKFYEDQFTFEDAEEECQYKWKGHLASLRSDKQAKTIGAYVTKENIERNYVWIGLQRLSTSNLYTGWRWMDGSRSRYTRWSSGKPNKLPHNEACVGLAPSSGHWTWIDLDCGLKLPFLCKWKPS